MAQPSTAAKRAYNNLAVKIFRNKQKIAGDSRPDFLIKVSLGDKKWLTVGSEWAKATTPEDTYIASGNIDLDTLAKAASLTVATKGA